MCSNHNFLDITLARRIGLKKTNGDQRSQHKKPEKLLKNT